MNEDQLKLNRECGAIIEAAAAKMHEMGVEPVQIVDRLLTYAVGNVVTWHGSAQAAEMLGRLADNVRAGVFASIDPTRPGKGH